MNTYSYLIEWKKNIDITPKPNIKNMYVILSFLY